MAERPLCQAPGAAHYVELRGALDPTAAEKRLSPVCSRRTPSACALRKEEIWRWLAADRTFAEPSIIDLRTAPDPHRAATRSGCRRTWRRICVSTAATRWCAISCCAVGDDRWYWYQRYPSAGGWLQLPGDNPADRRHLPRLAAGEATPESPFTPFAEVVDEYQRYAGSEAWQRDKAFWQAQRQALPAPASLSARAAGRAPRRERYLADEAGDERRRLPPPAAMRRSVARLTWRWRSTTLWLGRLCNRMDYAAGFIFMRRMGSAALTFDRGPVLNVLPLAVHIDARRRWRTWRCASPLG